MDLGSQRVLVARASTTESLEEVEEPTDLEIHMDKKELQVMLRNHLAPVLVSIVIEVFICYVYTSWSSKAEEDVRLLHRGEDVHMWTNVWHLRFTMWSVFTTCLALRVVAVVCWFYDCGPDSLWAAVTMFFCSVPFICYWIIFISMQNDLQVRSVSHDVMSSFELVIGSDNTSSLVDTCNRLFEAGACDMAASVGGESCCVRDMASLTLAGGGVVPLFGMAETLHIRTWYGMVIKWLSILAMSWVWKDMPLLPATAADTSFLNDVWIDLLDAAVFADYIVHPWIQYHRFNLFYSIYPGASEDNGRRCGAVACSGFLQEAIWYVWFFAFLSSILSPTLWTALRFCDKDSEDDTDIESLLADFSGQIRLLNQDSAKDMVGPLIHAQVKAYEEADGNREDHKHPVLVSAGDDTTDCTMEDLAGHRSGTAWFDPENQGFYLVAFHDDPGGEPELVAISRLEPDTKDHRKMFGAKCCTGWCKPSHLESKDNLTARYERRGNYVDAWRSLFLLELPFFIYRFNFLVTSGGSMIGGGMILLLKNAIFAMLDLMHIVACGNTKATCLSYTPIDQFEKFIKGSKLNAIFVGPGGMFKLAADLTSKTLQERAAAIRNRLNQHKAWLILEREKAESDKNDPDNDSYGYEREYMQDGYDREIQEFTDAIARVDAKLAEMSRAMKIVHA